MRTFPSRRNGAGWKSERAARFSGTSHYGVFASRELRVSLVMRDRYGSGSWLGGPALAYIRGLSGDRWMSAKRAPVSVVKSRSGALFGLVAIPLILAGGFTSPARANGIVMTIDRKFPTGVFCPLES